MKIYITEFDVSQETDWDDYIRLHPGGTLYHLAGWRRIIKNSYGHKGYYLMAVENGFKNSVSKNDPIIKGVLPLIHIKNILFGNSLISVPFCDYGGILADDLNTEKELARSAIRLAERLKANEIELRNIHLKQSFDRNNIGRSTSSPEFTTDNWHFQIRSHKVRMLFELPDSADKLMNSFKSKLRSQIRKAMRSGLKVKIGGPELLDDFYSVFTSNMKELGSPVHSKKIFENVIGEYKEKSSIMTVYQDGKPLAGSVVVGFKDTLENPWASSLREYSKLNPNMLLYWAMLEYGCENGYKKFDFGRSSPGEGTYRFKKQWGANAVPLHWQYISHKRKNYGNPISEDSKYQVASRIWKRLPEPVTKVVGPHLRKYIGL